MDKMADDRCGRPASKSVAMQAHAGGTGIVKSGCDLCTGGYPHPRPEIGDCICSIADHGGGAWCGEGAAVPWRLGVGVWSCCCLARPWLRRVRKLLSWTIQVAGAEPEI